MKVMKFLVLSVLSPLPFVKCSAHFLPWGCGLAGGQGRRAALSAASARMAAEVKLLFFHQAARLAATVRPEVIRASSWLSSMGSTGRLAADSSWLVRDRARQAARALG